MIQIYADSALAYDSRLEAYDLERLVITTGLNVGGTAEITMPQGHPAYHLFTSYRTIITVYRDGALRFRGRALYPQDDFYGSRTIVCEGELCLFRDAISRPHLYQTTPAEIFAAVIAEYNEQMDDFKRFKLGSVTVTDPNDYIRLESLNAETVLDTIKKLLDRCGGYIIFTTDDDGARVVNWLADSETDNNQVVEFGENLLNFASTEANTSLATGIIPYGAKKNSAGDRLTIEEVNGGKDYLLAEGVHDVVGTIMISHVWEDVYHADTLLRKAQEYLNQYKYTITSLELTALDLSFLDKTLDSFTVGDMVRVLSTPHGVDDFFQLTQLTEDLLNPEQSKITLGKEIHSLTRSDVEGDSSGLKELEKRTVEIKQDIQGVLQVAADMEQTLRTEISQSEDTIKLAVSQEYARKDALSQTEAVLSALIQQTSDSIKLEVSQEYVSNDQLAESISTKMTQLQDQFLFEFNTLRENISAGDEVAAEKLDEIYNYIRFENGSIHLGGSENNVTLTLEKDNIVFKKDGEPFGWWDGNEFHTGNIVVEVNERAQFGDFAFVPRSDGSLSFLKIGG